MRDANKRKKRKENISQYCVMKIRERRWVKGKIPSLASSRVKVVDFTLLVEVIGNSKPNIATVLIGAKCRVLIHSQVADRKLLLFNSGPVGGYVWVGVNIR